MAKKNHALSFSTLPHRIPTLFLAFWAFALYHFNAGAFWWGVYALFAVICIVVFGSLIFKEERHELFDENGKIRKELLP